MYVVERIEDREWVMPLYYEHLARFMVKDSELPSRAVVLEAGSGRGNVTLPILSILERDVAKYICYDLDEGPYQGCLSELKQKLSVLGLRKVEIMKGDVMDMNQIDGEAIDLVIANELLCDLTKEGVNKAMAEFFRVLKPGGQLIHGELSPVAENEAQEMAILVDKMTSLRLFAREWFSPPADELASWLHKTGFTDIGVRYFEETVRFRGEAAIYQIKNWLVKPEFYELNKGDIETQDMELPMNQVLIARKPKTLE